MKQTTFNNLLFGIFCSLTLSVISPSLIHAETDDKEEKNSLKIKLDANVGEGKSSLSLENSYKLNISDDESATFQYVKFDTEINNLLSNDLYMKISKKYNIGLKSMLKELTEKSIKKINIASNPIVVLENKKLGISLSATKPKFCSKLSLGGGVSLDGLPGGAKVGMGLYSNVFQDWKDIRVPFNISKKGLMSEEDSIELNTLFSIGEKYYSPWAKVFLGRIGGVSIDYKTNSEKGYLKGLTLSCSTPVTAVGEVKNKPSLSLKIDLNGESISELGLSSLCNMLPEKVQELCGKFSSVNLSLTKHFDKKMEVEAAIPASTGVIARPAVYQQQLAGKLENFTIQLEGTFKDVLNIEAECKLGLRLRLNAGGDGQDIVAFIASFSKKFDLI